jgi:hypothetical protein
MEVRANITPCQICPRERTLVPTGKKPECISQPVSTFGEEKNVSYTPEIYAPVFPTLSTVVKPVKMYIEKKYCQIFSKKCFL